MRSTGPEVPHTPRWPRIGRPLALATAALLAVLIGFGAMLMGAPGARAQQSAGAKTGQGAAHASSSRMSASDYAHLLPPTDMGAGAHLPQRMRMHAFDKRPATPFAMASIPRNPLAPNAVPVGAKSCSACHAREDIFASHALHVASFRAGSTRTGPQAACEACHGPGSAHAKNPDKPGLIISYTQHSATPIATQTTTCLGCHAGGARLHWIGSVHQRRGLTCTDCHNPMVRLSADGALANVSINQVCATCHRNVRAQFNRRSHMPLPEGVMSCADCHNPHGTITKPLLKTDTVNTTCFACHAEKRGPFLFAHAPVRESCLNCHKPHGSNHANLLVLPIPMLCQQCHANPQHPNDLLTRQNVRAGRVPDERVMQRGCLNCHRNIHGSNLSPTLLQ